MASRGTKRASSNDVAPGLKVQRMASFDEASKSNASAATPLARESSTAFKESGSTYVCWVCRRRFPDEEAMDRHVLYSRLHQDSIRRLGGRE
mmetsp:Transcript_15885/g.36488  ORF Transcript_15885/g.36488 Transcript_15885/m.36488 type:complete len:92 (+) Transcript_15885:126-401(+)